MSERHELDVCVDCLFLLANGGGDSVEPSWCPDNRDRRPWDYVCDGSCEAAATAHAAAVERNWPDPWILAPGSRECEWCGDEARGDDDTVEECEPWFSWAACDGCGSTLGGDRVHAAGFTP